MLYKTHMIAGVLFTETYLLVTKHEVTPDNLLWTGATLFIGAVSATLPDADQRQSWAGKTFFPISFLLSLLHVKHRGITHSILFTLLFWFGLRSIPSLPDYFVAGGTVGYMSHWMIDTFNQTGIQVLYPLQKKFKLPWFNIGVGGIGETIFSFICSAGIAVVTYFYAQPFLATLGLSDKLQFFSHLFSI